MYGSLMLIRGAHKLLLAVIAIQEVTKFCKFNTPCASQFSCLEQQFSSQPGYTDLLVVTESAWIIPSPMLQLFTRLQCWKAKNVRSPKDSL